MTVVGGEGWGGEGSALSVASRTCQTNSWEHLVNHTPTVKYRRTNTHSDGALWVGVTGEVEETLQQVSWSKELWLTSSQLISFLTFNSNYSQGRRVSSHFFKHRLSWEYTIHLYPEVLPVSAAGCSESCCPVIRCRQTCWELWRLAWSMLWKRSRHKAGHERPFE